MSRLFLLKIENGNARAGRWSGPSPTLISTRAVSVVAAVWVSLWLRTGGGSRRRVSAAEPGVHCSVVVDAAPAHVIPGGRPGKPRMKPHRVYVSSHGHGEPPPPPPLTSPPSPCCPALPQGSRRATD
jgi:hypothetical protein